MAGQGAGLAQIVERQIEDLRVGGALPSPGTMYNIVRIMRTIASSMSISRCPQRCQVERAILLDV